MELEDVLLDWIEQQLETVDDAHKERLFNTVIQMVAICQRNLHLGTLTFHLAGNDVFVSIVPSAAGETVAPYARMLGSTGQFEILHPLPKRRRASST